MSSLVAIADTAVLVRNDSNTLAGSAPLAANAGLCMVIPFRATVRRVPRPRLGQALLGVSSLDCRSLRAPALSSPRDRLPLPSIAVRASVPAYPQELPLHLRPLRPWSQVTTDGFAHVQKVFAESSNAGR